MEVGKIQSRYCVLYEFERGHRAADAGRNFYAIYSDNVGVKG